MQVHTVLLQLATRWPQLSVALMVGGTDVNADITAWREKGGHVLVGTPGRLDDLMVRLGSEMMLRELELLHRREDPLRKHQVGALIIEPTRELAVQVAATP